MNNAEDNRKLTEAEEKRKKEYEKIKEEMLKQGYEEKDLTIGVVYANVMAFVMAAPLIVLFFILYCIMGYEFYYFDDYFMIFIFAACFFASIVIHELIHGLFWGIFAEAHFKSIEFGFIAQYFTPYCTCKSPLRKHQYIIGSIMPTVILGILPCIVSLFIGQSVFLYFGLIMILSGGADLIIVYKILFDRSEEKEVLYLDHPYKCGTMKFEK